MKKVKYRTYFMCLGFVCLLLAFGLIFHIGGKSKPITANDKIPISRVAGSFIIDVYNQRELIGSADYVFVGEVISKDGYDYRDPVTIDRDGEMVTLTSPYTNYTVQVLENIKGNLRTDTSIPIAKDGGLSEDGSCYVLYENDEFPAEKELYIFYAYAQQDGSLLLAGPNSNIKIEYPNGSVEYPNDSTEYPNDSAEYPNANAEYSEDNLKDFYKNTDIYKEVVDASMNPEFVDRVRSASIYESME